MKKSLWVFGVVFLFGCATVGREVSQDQLTGFEKGKTTLTEVVQKLGNPTSSTVTADGRKTVAYAFAHAQVRPANFIPIVGPLVGGTDTRSSSVIFMFNREGVLENYIASQGNLGMGQGFSAGRYQAPDQTQPQEVVPR